MMSTIKYPYLNLSLKDLKGEQWDDIPFLDGAYEMSNYGRIKSKKRYIERSNNRGFWLEERIIKPTVSIQNISGNTRTLYRLSATVSFEGRKISVSIARTVYFLFKKKFDMSDRKLVVSMKDEDPFNIRTDNLVLISPAVNIKKAYDKNRRKRESFGNKAAIISQYDFTGNWIKSYPSIAEASRITGIGSGQIARALGQLNSYANDYIWRYGNQQKKLSKVSERVIKKLESDKLHSTVVTQYDNTGKKIREYKNLKAAAKAVGGQTNAIRNVILGNSFSAKNFYWVLGRGAKQISMKAIEKMKHESRDNIRQPVTQYDLTGKKIRSYISISEAAKTLQVHSMNIAGALQKPGHHTSTGFLWIRGDGPKTIKTSTTVRRGSELRALYSQAVSQYNREGIRINLYDSLKQAATIMQLSLSHLVLSVTGKAHSYRGFYWRKGKGPAKIKVIQLTKTHQNYLQKVSKPVIQYTITGKKMNEYESITAASKATNTASAQIKAVAIGKYKFAKGYSWKFK